MCDHRTFKVEAKVTRLTDQEDSEKVTGYTTDITVHCADCFKPFRWKGVPGGFSFGKPTVSLTGLELRAPIEPVS